MDGDRQAAPMPAMAMFPQVNSLPRTERKATPGDGYLKVVAGQNTAYMRRHVIRPLRVMPEARITVRNEFREESLEVAANPGIRVFAQHE